MNRTRLILLAAIAVIVAGVCIRLGFWQLDRLQERRVENARVAAGIAGEPIEIDRIGGDSTQSRAQRVRVRGTYDFEHEVVLLNRSREGAPGVHILTPIRLAGSDTAVVVNRGWVYSPDGATVNVAQWREDSVARGTAYVSWLPALRAPPTDTEARGAELSRSGRRVPRLDRDAIAEQMPYPIAPYQLILLDEGAGSRTVGGGYADGGPSGAVSADSTRPVRIPLPALDEGPHVSYAVQWFSFAAIALIGTLLVTRSEWSSRRVNAPHVG